VFDLYAWIHARSRVERTVRRAGARVITVRHVVPRGPPPHPSARRRNADGQRYDEENQEDPEEKDGRLELDSPSRPGLGLHSHAAGRIVSAAGFDGRHGISRSSDICSRPNPGDLDADPE
jgi:hypothetical protein